MSIASRLGDVATLPKNPCKYFIQFKNDAFQYYDKEKKETVVIGDSIKFIELRELTTVKGYDAMNDCGIWSNEVANEREDILVVKSFKGGDLETGIWEEIKADVVAAGGKYAKSVYILWNGQLANLMVKGAVFGVADKTVAGGWFKRNQNGPIAYEVKSFTEGKKGKVKFKIPVFDEWTPTEAEYEQAESVYKETLRPYLNKYLEIKQKEARGEVRVEKDQLTEKGRAAVEAAQKGTDVDTDQLRKEMGGATNAELKADLAAHKAKQKDEEVAAEDLPF